MTGKTLITINSAPGVCIAKGISETFSIKGICNSDDNLDNGLEQNSGLQP